MSAALPNDIQRVLIERASRLMVYIETMDAQALEDGTMSEPNSRQYLAWTNSFAADAARAWVEGRACREAA
jgi:hypothetical protein